MTRIVIVEDQKVLASVYRNKFLAEGFQVEIASDGEEGLALILSTMPDLVILDLMLPKINGLEVLKKLRADPAFHTLPVIVFSNASLPGTVESVWRAGATMVLSKSSHSPKEIVEAARAALKAARESDPLAAPPATNDAGTKSPDIAVSTEGRSATGHVLLVEDHADTRALMSFLLEQANHPVTSVDSHAEALR